MSTHMKSDLSLEKAKKAWERKTLGVLENDDYSSKASLLREANFAWGHIKSARRAIGEGFEAKARASYNYYLNRFQSHSAILITDVFLRLAILENNVGNVTGARSAFRLGARSLHEALYTLAQEENSKQVKHLRERGATLYCSWGLHEYRFARFRTHEERVKRSRRFFQVAAHMDASKSPILAWNRFQEAAKARDNKNSPLNL